MKYAIGKSRARTFYIKRGIITEEAFVEIFWEDITNALMTKPHIYHLWYGKQGSGYC